MDSVGDSINAENANWNFEGEVSKTFDEHVSKSVPLYYEGHDLCAKISDFFLANDSVCYELGCSTGSLTKKLAERNIDKRVRFIAVDSVDNMIEQANKKLSQYSSVETKVEDINLAEMEKSDFIVSYYTIQFVRPQLRQELINKIYNSLNWGGWFFAL